MKAIITGVAVAALAAASPAVAAGGTYQLAQSEPQVEQQQEMQSAPECPQGATVTAEGEACPPDAAAPAETAADAMPAEAEAAESEALEAQPAETAESEPLKDEPAETVTAGDRFVKEQAEDAILASELIGETVYNPADEALGDVNDIVWTDEDGVQAVVIGVGGFLGIGEKAVAVAYSAIDISTDADGNRKLLLNATEEELTSAPTFLTASEKLAMIRAEQEAQLPAASGGGVNPAPAPEPAPAQ